MRIKVLTLSFATLVSVVGCSGGDDGVTPIPDAKIFMDAGVDAAPVCSVATSLGSLNLGSMMTPVVPMTGDWFVVPTMGPWMGKTVFAVGAFLPTAGGTQSDDALFVQVVKPSQGQWQENTAINFDPSPSTLMVANSFIFEDYNSTGGTFTRLLYAGSGSVTFTDIGETGNALIIGTVAATNYREVDKMSGADVAAGCTSSLMQLKFYLKQPMNPMRETPVDVLPAVNAPLGVFKPVNQ